MKKTGFLYDERYQLHLTGDYHPEMPDRLPCIYRGIQEAGLLSRLIHIKARRADMKWIEMVHDGRYIMRFEAACLSGKSMFDSPDNQVCYDTYEAALLAVGGILDVVSRVMEGVGFFNPQARGQEEGLRLDDARIDYWISKGAKPSERVASLIKGARKTAA